MPSGTADVKRHWQQYFGERVQLDVYKEVALKLITFSALSLLRHGDYVVVVEKLGLVPANRRINYANIN